MLGAYCVFRMLAKSSFPNFPSGPRFILSEQDLTNPSSRVNDGNLPSKSPSRNVSLTLLDLFQLAPEVWCCGLCEIYSGGYGEAQHDESLRTSSDFFSGNVCAVNCSTHRSSTSEVVACQRYRQLSCTTQLEPEIYHDHRTYLNATHISPTSFKDAMIFFPKLAGWVQAPGVSLPRQAENGR